MKYDDCKFAVRAEGEGNNTKSRISRFPPRVAYYTFSNTFSESAKLHGTYKQLGGNEEFSVQVLEKNTSYSRNRSKITNNDFV